MNTRSQNVCTGQIARSLPGFGLLMAAYPVFVFHWSAAAIMIAIGLLLLRRRPLAIRFMYLVACPFLLVPLLAFGAGIFAYAAGIGSLQTIGLPDPEFCNLDSRYRCQHSTTGCIVYGHEAWYQLPYNAALKAMILVLGPMPGAYTGPYPLREEAWDYLAEYGTPGSAGETLRRLGEIRGPSRDYFLLALPKGDTATYSRAEYGEELELIGSEQMLLVVERKRGRSFALYVNPRNAD